MEALRIERLSLNFGGLQVLRNLSLSIEVGERVAIIGPNGAGKTTLINVIDGGLSAAAGHIYLLGQEITAMPIHCRAQRGLARSFQINRLFFDLSVLDNVLLALFGIRPSRLQMFRPVIAHDEILSKGQKLLAQTNLWKKKDELVRHLSYGEQRLLDVALGLASEPKVLLLDEPTSGVASAEIPDVLNAMAALAGDTTVLLTSHDMDVVFHFAKRVITIYFGEIIADGTPSEIQANPKVRQIYLGAEGTD